MTGFRGRKTEKTNPHTDGGFHLVYLLFQATHPLRSSVIRGANRFLASSLLVHLDEVINDYLLQILL